MAAVDSLMFSSSSITDVFTYIFITLFSTALWVYIYRHRSFMFLALAMFFPGLFALGMQLYRGSLVRFLSFLSLHPQWSTFYWTTVASLYPLAVVGLCCLLNYLIGWGQFRTQQMTVQSIHEHNQKWIYGWIRAMGEEIGWRSYLLPNLLLHFHPIKLSQKLNGNENCSKKINDATNQTFSIYFPLFTHHPSWCIGIDRT